MPAWLVAELRSDHAGEIGAICIYQGILTITNEKAVEEFAKNHLATEKKHLELIETLCDKQDRSLLIPVWKLSGFLIGAISALMGQKAVFAAISAVETFVVSHYQSQINRLQIEKLHPDTCSILQSCCDDEARHESEASEMLDEKPKFFVRSWCFLISVGSNLAVKCARII